MKTVLGIDVGTSSLKVLLLDCERGVLGVAQEGYEVSIVQPGYGEQDPETWWNALLVCLKQLRENHPEAYGCIQAISFSGQMHGLVALDASGHPIRPAILWLDQRSEAECQEIRDHISQEEQTAVLQNRIFPGFAFPSLVWMRNHEKEYYDRIWKIMQPKDYIRYRLTGLVGTEVTDASATLMFDVRNRDWAWKVIQENGLPREFFPDCHESGEIQGCICDRASQETGLPVTAQVTYGMGDQQAQSVGNGVIQEGRVICNIGTGGQVSVYSSEDRYDPQLRTHTFCHCIDRAYTIFGATLNGGIALKWLKDQILQEDSFQTLSQLAWEIPAGSEGLIFLPYLNGERTPYMNPDARGMFFGLSISHDRRHMTRAVMEGITFSLKQSLDILEEMGIRGGRIIASGGGANSEVWLQMQADIFGKEVQVCKVSEQACLGACILAGVASGSFKNVQEACDQLVEYEDKIYVPNQEHREKYRVMYKRFQLLYHQTESRT